MFDIDVNEVYHLFMVFLVVFFCYLLIKQLKELKNNVKDSDAKISIIKIKNRIRYKVIFSLFFLILIFFLGVFMYLNNAMLGTFILFGGFLILIPVFLIGDTVEDVKIIQQLEEKDTFLTSKYYSYLMDGLIVIVFILPLFVGVKSIIKHFFNNG